MLHLQELAKQGEQTVKLTLQERLPLFLKAPCTLQVNYKVEPQDNFYLMHFHTQGQISVVCQRCLQEFDTSYDNSTILAVCSTEERAEQLLEYYETIVSVAAEVDLSELINDELHLYAPQCHVDNPVCDRLVNPFLTKASGT